MFASNIILAMVLVGVSARHIEDPYNVFYEVEEQEGPQYLLEEYHHPGYIASARVRRQIESKLALNSDGSTGMSAKVPLAHNDKNTLSAIGSLSLDNKMNTASKGIGLALDNANGHGLSVMKESIPGYGSTLTGAGHATLFNNDKHAVGANAFVTRNMPTNYPGVPNYNTVGGGLDYTYKNKIGASLGMAHTPYLDRKEYSAMGNLNLFRNPTTSVDFNAGFRRMDSPMMHSGWKPNFDFIFSKSF